MYWLLMGCLSLLFVCVIDIRRGGTALLFSHISFYNKAPSVRLNINMGQAVN